MAGLAELGSRLPAVGRTPNKGKHISSKVFDTDHLSTYAVAFERRIWYRKLVFLAHHIYSQPFFHKPEVF